MLAPLSLWDEAALLVPQITEYGASHSPREYEPETISTMKC